MTDLTLLLPKLDPLIRRLASDVEPEALSALRALGRALARGGADFNDLADHLNREPEVAGWDHPRPWRPEYDAVTPKRYKAPFRPSGPPLWDRLDRAGRMAWLERIIAAESLTQAQRAEAAAMRAQYYSQPHKLLKPAQTASIDGIFAEAWLSGLRPVADVPPGDTRTPLRWDWKNRQHCRLVLEKARPFLSPKEQTACAMVVRMADNPRASVEEVGKIEAMLMKAYDLGARP